MVPFSGVTCVQREIGPIDSLRGICLSSFWLGLALLMGRLVRYFRVFRRESVLLVLNGGRGKSKVGFDKKFD